MWVGAVELARQHCGVLPGPSHPPAAQNLPLLGYLVLTFTEDEVNLEQRNDGGGDSGRLGFRSGSIWDAGWAGCRDGKVLMF